MYIGFLEIFFWTFKGNNIFKLKLPKENSVYILHNKAMKQPD